MLTKIRIADTIPSIDIHPLLKKVINEYFIEDSIYFTNGKVVINNKSNDTYSLVNNNIILLNKLQTIPILFNNIFIWKSINVFDQNNTHVAKNVRFTVINMFKNNTGTLYGIGGEFYGYFVSMSSYDNYVGYSNNDDILECAKFNCELYCLNYELKKLDYNKKIKFKNNGDIIINLSTITPHIINHLIDNKYNNIIIINCKSKNINRIKTLFETYKLISFERFDIVNIIYFKLK